MKTNILYSCIGLLLVSVISLSVYIAIRKPVCERIHIDDNMKLWGTKDAIPNEETAKKIADIIIEAQSGFSEHLKLDYDFEISFNEQNNAWEVYYSPIPPEGYLIEGGGIEIHIKRDSGMVAGLVFYK